MDLIERPQTPRARHPWETARAEAIRSLVTRLDLKQPGVLDVGCGDGFVSGYLRQHFSLREAVAQDIHLTPALVKELAQPGVEFVQELDQIAGRRFELVVLLDVLEHVKEPAALLSRLRQDHLAAGGWMLMTVPAFQVLFSQHDRHLKHERRYSRPELAELAQGAGLSVHDSGYLFATLLLPRTVIKLREWMLPTAVDPAPFIGGWNGPAWLRGPMHKVLSIDNRICLEAQRKGLLVPGLSTWVLCNAA